MNSLKIACMAVVGFAAMMGASQAKADGEIFDTVHHCTQNSCLVTRCIHYAGFYDCATGWYPRFMFPDYREEP